MTDVPIWFMDVDGVVNIFPKGAPSNDVERGEASPFISTGLYEASTFPITWRKSILSRIAALHESGVVKVVWLTTWGRGANYGLHELLGLPRLEVVADPQDAPYRSMGWHTWWKAEALRRYISEHDVKKFVWTDDDLAAQSKQIVDIVSMEDAQSMIISTNEREGITHEHLDDIEEFLTALDVQTGDHGI